MPVCRTGRGSLMWRAVFGSKRATRISYALPAAFTGTRAADIPDEPRNLTASQRQAVVGSPWTHSPAPNCATWSTFWRASGELLERTTRLTAS